MASKTISVLHQNIQSMRANFDLFSVYLASLNSQRDLIFVSEIWIYSYESAQYYLPNYNFIACCNDNYRSGGVGVFIHNKFINSKVHYYHWPSADVLILNIPLGKDDWTFICLYRFCDKDINAFCVDLENLLGTLNNPTMVILGDMNINLLNSNESYNYQSMLASFGFISLVNDPTRISTCLDHVFVKSPNRFNFSVDNLPINFSDHNLIQLDILSPSIRPISTNSASHVSHVDYNQLRENLQFENWASVYCESNCNAAFTNFIQILNGHVEASKFVTIGQNIKKLKPWMNSYLLRKIAKLKKFSTKLRHYPNNARLQKFVKTLSRNVKSSTKTVKHQYYINKFNSVGTNSKRTWKVIDDVLGRNSIAGPITQIYKCNTNTLLTTPQAISDEFNKFFINTSSALSPIFGKVNASNPEEFNRYVLGFANRYSMSCFFEPILCSEIISEITKLKNKRSKGVDEIDNIIIKQCSWYLVDVLVYLYNMSLDTGIFPDALKVAIVVPIHKKGDKCTLNNYRPISLLSTFSKLFEKLVKRRLMNYLNKIKFLHGSQFGFIAGKSTEEALLHFLSYIHSKLNISQKPTSLFVDISKAFDTVDHNILLMKLFNLGIRGHIFKWFESFLQNRRQVVKINEFVSTPGLVTCGVPQGSVLGPILFLIYFNSIFEADLVGHATAFADDLALSYASEVSSNDVQLSIQRDLCNLSKWFYYHKLAVSEKSRIMNFARPNISNNVRPMKYHVFSCNGISCLPHCFELQLVSEFKYLGLTIDSQLNWNRHLSTIRQNVVNAVHKFFNLRQFCPQMVLRQLYHALVESIIMYGISSWGGIYFSNIKDLYISQKRIIKLIYRRRKITPTVPLFREVNLLPLRYLYIYKVLKMFFIRSSSFHNRITHTYSMRNPNNFARLHCNNEKFRRFYLFMAPYWFHKLPKRLKSLTIERKHFFDRELRVWLLNVDNIENYF